MDLKTTRERMVAQQIEARGIKSPAVLDAMRKAPRHLFVDKAFHTRAYDDNALPIGEGQTISQPYVVALMTEALKISKGAVVLEIGTGSGYQAAVLAEMGMRIYTVERQPALAKRCRDLFEKSGYKNIAVRIADGTIGWKDYAPFDAIIVTAGTPQVPLPLLAQLKDGGRLVAPVGGEESQELVVMEKRGEEFVTETLGGVCFVKLIGAHGWQMERKAA